MIIKNSAALYNFADDFNIIEDRPVYHYGDEVVVTFELNAVDLPYLMASIPMEYWNKIQLSSNQRLVWRKATAEDFREEIERSIEMWHDYEIGLIPFADEPKDYSDEISNTIVVELWHNDKLIASEKNTKDYWE